ncbi:hypothetical protein BKA69DRAFT_1037274 [Paraphysoderma sedebokerense]|nr:hypothetical protein BKA69DRAFT_1037274 [Paraphysoderma sedebokerense]
MICREWKTKDWVWENTELGKSYVEKKAHILEITADVDMVIEESTRSESGIPPRRKRKLLELNDTENNSDDQSENRRCKSTEILNAIRRKVDVSGKINDMAASSVGSLASGIESMNDALTDDEEATQPGIVVSRAAHMLHLLNNQLTESEPETLDSLIKIFHYQGIHPKSFQTKLLQHILSPSSSRKALALIGPPDCGKRFILDALREIFKVSLVGMGGSSMIVELPQTTSVIHVPHSSSQQPIHATSSSTLSLSSPQAVVNQQGINIGGSKFASLLEADIVVLEHVTSLIRSNTLSEAEFLHLLSDTSIFSVPTLKLTPSTQDLNQQQPVYVMSNVPVPKLPVIYVADDMNLRGIESREEALSKLETLARFKRNGTPLFKAGKPDGRAMAWFLCRWTG